MSDSLVELFGRLAAAVSPSGHERLCADVAISYLQALGLRVEEDDAGARLGGDSGNLYCRLAPTVEGGVPLFFCAHLDTVPVDGPVAVVEREGYLSNPRPAIVGADDKSAVAVLLDAVRTVVEKKIDHAGLELVLTVREEQALRGAKAFDVSRLRATTGYVYDHAAPIGGMVLAAPSRTVVEAVVTGRAAHAGISPEDGRNAIVAVAAALGRLQHGRVDALSSVNVGRIEGGAAINVVAERCTVALEVRSLDDARCRSRVAAIVAAFEDAAQALGCEATVSAREEYYAYSLDAEATPVRLARAALLDCGFEPVPLHGGGGADAHVFTAAGRPCLNLANGMEGMHSPDERIAVRDLHAMHSVTLALIEQAARTQ